MTDSASFQGRLYELLGVQDNEVKGLMKKRGKDTHEMLVIKKVLRERFLKLPTVVTDEELKWLVFFFIYNSIRI